MVSAKHVVAVDRLKVVVRRLPPNLPEDIFWESVKPWVTDDTATWRSFIKGKVSQRSARESVPSRAYVTFKTHDAVAAFSRDFEGHLYRDRQGNETRAIVEFAPFQKVPPTEVKPDSKYVGTITNDPYYVQFVDGLANVKKLSEADTLEAYLHAASETKEVVKSTPLLEALKAEKEKAREAALARRHALAQQEKENKKGGERKAAAAAAAAAATAASGSSPATPARADEKPSRNAKRAKAAKEKEKAAAAAAVTPKIIMKNNATNGVEARSDAGTVASGASAAPGPATSKPEPRHRTPRGAAKAQAADASATATGTDAAPAKPERKRGPPPGMRNFEMALSGAVAGPRKERRGGGPGSKPAPSVPAPGPGVIAVDVAATGNHPHPPSERGGGRGGRRGRGRGAPPPQAG